MDITVLEFDDGNLDITHDFDIMESEIQNESDNEEVSDFFKRFEQYDEKSKSNLEETEIVNIGTETEVKEIRISIHLNEEQKRNPLHCVF